MAMYPVRTYPPLFDTDGKAGYASGRWKFILVQHVGWTASHTGSGGSYAIAFNIGLSTGTTASSRAMLYTRVFGLNSGDISCFNIDWTKRLELHFTIERNGSDPECVARFQLKESNVEGALSERGIGIEINNFAVVGESYGTARGTVSLGTIPSTVIKRFRIVKDINRVEFWVDDVKLGELTGSYVPNVKGTATAFVVASVRNGTTGGVACWFEFGNIYIFQEW